MPSDAEPRRAACDEVDEIHLARIAPPGTEQAPEEDADRARSFKKSKGEDGGGDRRGERLDAVTARGSNAC